MAVKKNIVKTTLANSYATFKALLDSIGGAKKTITVAADINIDTSFTFPSNIDLDFINQSKLIIGAGVVITNGINLGGRDFSHQIIECAPSDRPSIVSNYYRASWFGGGTDEYVILGNLTTIGIKIVLTTAGEVKVEKFVSGVLVDSTVILGVL